MAYDANLVAWAEEALAPVGTVSMRKMMGACVLYLDGTIFAVVEDEIWFKADAESAAIWDAEGCERFTFTLKDGTVEAMNYRRAPSDVYDDAEAMQRYAAVAAEAGRRRPVKKRSKKPKPSLRGA
jgi:DNA transformation protein